MSQQPSTSRVPVALAAFFLVLALGAFGVAFYLFDGTGAVSELIASVAPSPAPEGSAPSTSTAEPGLKLPDGMSEEFALRLWQEQLDSQEMIGRLVSGEVESLRIDRIAKRENDADLFVTVRFADAPQVSGAIRLRRIGSEWYIASVGALTDGGLRDADDPVPSIDDVDTELINTMIAENRKSQPVIAEYLAGIVREVTIDRVVDGPHTATMQVTMDESHGDGYATLVAIESEIDGRPAWFLARFIKTGDESAKP